VFGGVVRCSRFFKGCSSWRGKYLRLPPGDPIGAMGSIRPSVGLQILVRALGQLLRRYLARAFPLEMSFLSEMIEMLGGAIARNPRVASAALDLWAG
jgi:hypothetical protein